MFAKPVLQPETEELDKCFLCNKTIHKHELKQSVGASGLKTIEEKAKVWEKINVPEDDDKYREFTKVVERLTRLQGEDCHFNVHGSCRVSFRTQCDKKLKQYGRVIESPTEDQSSTDSQNVSAEMSKEKKRHSERVVGKPKLLCFVCNTKTAADSKPYNEGGLGRCSEKGSKDKLTNSMRRRNKPEDVKWTSS